MGLFSIFRKNKQDSTSDDSEFFTRTEDDSNAMRGRSKRKQRKQGNEPVDPALPEKKRARRRLVGAVALVLAAIIALPMILDSEPKPLADDIAIQIPAKDIPAPQPRNTASAELAPVAPKVPASARAEKDEEIIQSTATSAAPKDSATKLSRLPDTATGAQPDPESVPKADDKMAASAIPPRRPDDSERARAILEGRNLASAEGAVASNEVKPERYVVQVAALASKDKVKELQNKLKSAGIKTYTQKIATANGDRIRIRVGPFANREEADRMRAKIGKLGLNGTLVPA